MAGKDRDSQAAEQARRRRQQARPTAPAARAPVRTGGRMGPNFAPTAARARVLPTQNRLAAPARMYYRGGQYVPGGFSGTAGRAGILGQSPTGTFAGVRAPVILPPGGGGVTVRGAPYAGFGRRLPIRGSTAANPPEGWVNPLQGRQAAFNRWRGVRDRAGRPV